MNEEQRHKIYLEMKMIMTERNHNNKYTNGHLTITDLLNIIQVTFYGSKSSSPPSLENVIDEIWSRIIGEMKDEIMMSNLEKSFDEINLQETSLSNLLTNLNLTR